MMDLVCVWNTVNTRSTEQRCDATTGGNEKIVRKARQGRRRSLSSSVPGDVSMRKRWIAFFPRLLHSLVCSCAFIQIPSTVLETQRNTQRKPTEMLLLLPWCCGVVSCPAVRCCLCSCQTDGYCVLTSSSSARCIANDLPVPSPLSCTRRSRSSSSIPHLIWFPFHHHPNSLRV